MKLLHNQLLFERHKCDLHAIRNRRLIGKTFKAVQHQEELQATVSERIRINFIFDCRLCFTVYCFFSLHYAYYLGHFCNNIGWA